MHYQVKNYTLKRYVTLHLDKFRGGGEYYYVNVVCLVLLLKFLIEPTNNETCKSYFKIIKVEILVELEYVAIFVIWGHA